MGVARRAHDQVGLAGVGAQGIGKLVLGFAGARLADAALRRGIGTQQVSTTFNGDVVFFSQFVDAFQADIAPGSNVIVPDDDVNRVGVVGMAVGGRLGGHGGTSAVVPGSGEVKRLKLYAVVPALAGSRGFVVNKPGTMLTFSVTGFPLSRE